MLGLSAVAILVQQTLGETTSCRGARDLCLKLCRPDPISRFSAKEALGHPWLSGFSLGASALRQTMERMLRAVFFVAATAETMRAKKKMCAPINLGRLRLNKSMMGKKERIGFAMAGWKRCPEGYMLAGSGSPSPRKGFSFGQEPRVDFRRMYRCATLSWIVGLT